MTKNEEPLKLGRSVVVSAKIKDLTVGKHSDKINWTDLNFSAAQSEIVTEMVKQECEVLVTIDLPTPDPKFKMQSKATLKSSKISKTCDAPSLVNMQFSTKQVMQLSNLIRSEEEISLSITEIQPELPMEAQD